MIFKIKWYSCGPTVYSNTHLGHARTYVCQDIIRRILEKYDNKSVFYLMGITDIDDKIIKRSMELKVPIDEISRKYEKEFFDSLKQLNVLPPTVITRVTDHMDDITKYIQKIVDNGYAYKTPSGIYFDTSKLGDEKYNIFNINFKEHLEEMNEDNSTKLDKKSPKDFVLWKYPTFGPLYTSQFGPGRPGWHIECSTMTNSIFGNYLDIHSGGEDLRFPHHMNENAQCVAYNININNYQWVNKFIHIGHVYIKDKKMSKSLKNFITVEEMLKLYKPNTFRYFCLQFKYNQRIHYSNDRMIESQISLTKIIGVYMIIIEFIIYIDTIIN